MSTATNEPRPYLAWPNNGLSPPTAPGRDEPNDSPAWWLVNALLRRRRANPVSMVVILKLMSYRHDHDLSCRFDFEQRNISRIPERNHQFSQEGTVAGLAARERGTFECGDARSNRIHGLFGKCEVASIAGKLAFQHKVEKAFEVGLCIKCESNPEIHRAVFGMRARAESNLRCNESITVSASTYCCVRRASSRERNPRAMNSDWVRRRSTLARTEASTNSDKLSPSARTASTSARNFASTRTEGMLAVFISRL
jgi:hypothetical protein